MIVILLLIVIAGASCVIIVIVGVVFKRKIRTHLDLLSIPQWRENVKTSRWDQRLQIQNLFMTFKRVPRWK